MEPLCKPSQVDFTFRPEPGSSLDSILKNAGPVPNRRSQGASLSLFPSHSQSKASTSQGSDEATSDLNEYTQKFNAVMKNFTDLGDSEEFARQLEGIIGTSLKVIQEKRSFVAAVTAAMDDFLEPEEKGGLELASIRKALDKVVYAQQSNLTLQIDQVIIREILKVIKSMPKSVQRKVQAENDEIEVGDDEEEEPENEELAAEVAVLADPDYLVRRRLELDVTFASEKALHQRNLDKIINKISNKRGYGWKVENGIINYGSCNAEDLRGVVSETIRKDPITRRDITDPVKSTLCQGEHIYERSSLLEMIRRKATGMKCAYRACDKFIRTEDIVEDLEYARMLARNIGRRNDDTSSNTR